MGTRKNNKKSKKSNKRFRKTRLKRQRGGDPNDDLVNASDIDNANKIIQALEDGADVNAKDKYGDTALIRASLNGHTEIVAMLLEKGADANAKDKYGETALYWAIQIEHTEIVALLTAAIEAEKKVKGHKQEAMKLVRHRDVKIPSLFNFAYGQLPTSEISIINEYELPRKKLGGKRKSNIKTKKSKRKTRKTRRK